jgi:hypothetical protein
MAYLFTRQQLYERVWSEPTTTIAKSLAISAVGLAKACRRGDIPVPPRGYWARLNAGQRMTRTPLPLRAPGATDRVTVGSGDPQVFQAEGDGDEHDPEGTQGENARVKRDALPPEPPVYNQTLEQIEARTRQALPAKFRFMRTHRSHG